MKSHTSARKLTAFAGIAAVLVITSACGGGENAPETSTTPTTTTTATTSPAAPPPSPTEKSMEPGSGNKFTPTHVEPPAPPTGRRGYLPTQGLQPPS